MNYPIKICLFPEIVSDKEPSIHPCEKGRAICQLIHSTLMQTQDLNDNKTVKKMMDMVKDFEFYKFNLCSDIEKNTEFLRDFMNNLEKRERKTITEDKIYLDITFDFANILCRTPQFLILLRLNLLKNPRFYKKYQSFPMAHK